MLKFLVVLLFIFTSFLNCANAYDTRLSPELRNAFGKQQQRSTDSKGNTILVTPHYRNYAERNENVTEKVVAIYDKRSPAYGYKYILYTPIGKYVGHHKVMQSNGNLGLEPVPEGGEGSEVPCFRSLKEAKHFYYPEWY